MSKTLKRKRTWAWIGWTIGLIALAGAGVAYQRARPRTRLQLRVQPVVRGRVRDLVSTVAAGRLAARREATIRAEIAGRIVRLGHRRGARVEANEVVVVYDSQDLRERVRAADTAVSLAAAQIGQAEASAQLAARSAGRARTLAARGVTPEAEAETLEGQAEVARRAVASANAARTQGLASAAVARSALTRAVVRAPFAGVILSTHVEEGEVSAPGGPLFVVADDRELHIDAELDEADLGRVRVSMAAEVSFDAFASERFEGRVREIAPSVTQDLRGNRAVAIRVSIANEPRFRVGMSADVDVVVATRENVVNVPPGAVLGRGTDRAVYVLAGGVVRRRPITTGISTWEAVEVVRGVSVGERVVTSLNVQGLEDGALAQERSAPR